MGSMTDAPSSPTQEEREIAAFLRREAEKWKEHRLFDHAHALFCAARAIESSEWRTQHKGGSND